VLQNKKYIAFAEENTVEVLSLDGLDEGIEKKDKRAGTYKAKDTDGQEKDFMLGWPNLTAEDIKNLRGSKAGSYNQTGKIPYTAIVDPHTLEEMDNIKGGYGAGTLQDLVTAKKKELEKAHGKGVSRKTLTKVKEADAGIRKALADGNLVKALTDSAALQKKVAKESPAIVEMAQKTGVEVLEAAGKQLDEIEAMITRGESAAAMKQLGPLSRALKGTTLEDRALGLLSTTRGVCFLGGGRGGAPPPPCPLSSISRPFPVGKPSCGGSSHCFSSSCRPGPTPSTTRSRSPGPGARSSAGRRRGRGTGSRAGSRTNSTTSTRSSRSRSRRCRSPAGSAAR
jgi:hypothetical protein